MRKAPAEGAPRKLVLSSIDAIMAEILSGSAALHELMGQCGKSGRGAEPAGRIVPGQARTKDAKGGLRHCRPAFAADELPEARTAIAGRIVAEFKSAKRLCPDSLVEELKALRRLANTRGDGRGQISQPRRSDRGLHLALQAAGDPGNPRPLYRRCVRPTRRSSGCCSSKKISSASENKRQLASFVTAGAQFRRLREFLPESQSRRSCPPAAPGVLQGRVRRSSFIDVQRQEIADKMDRLACDVADARQAVRRPGGASNQITVEKARRF